MRTLHHDGDLPRQPEYQIHIVLDQQQCDVLGQFLDDLDDPAAFARRHAGGRLVEQQHLRVQAEGDGDFRQALAPVGQRADRAQRILPEPQPFDQGESLFDRGAVPSRRAEQAAGDALPLADRQRHVFEQASARERVP